MKKKAEVMAFCGIDGCGKSTQLNLVHDILTNDGYNVMDARLAYFPLNEMGLSKFKDLLLKADSCLHILKYYTHIELHEKNDYDFILFDRHLLCYFAYAYAYNALPKQVLKSAYSVLPRPDLTFYFDVDVNTSLKRIQSRESKQIDKSENFDTLTKAKEGYTYLLESTDESVEATNANGAICNTQRQVIHTLNKHLKR